MNDLRKKVKLVKALYDIPYKEIAEYIDLPQKSFYNWLKGYYEFGEKRTQQLEYALSLLGD